MASFKRNRTSIQSSLVRSRKVPVLHNKHVRTRRFTSIESRRTNLVLCRLVTKPGTSMLMSLKSLYWALAGRRNLTSSHNVPRARLNQQHFRLQVFRKPIRDDTTARTACITGRSPISSISAASDATGKNLLTSYYNEIILRSIRKLARISQQCSRRAFRPQRARQKDKCGRCKC